MIILVSIYPKENLHLYEERQQTGRQWDLSKLLVPTQQMQVQLDPILVLKMLLKLI